MMRWPLNQWATLYFYDLYNYKCRYTVDRPDVLFTSCNLVFSHRLMMSSFEPSISSRCLDHGKNWQSRIYMVEAPAEIGQGPSDLYLEAMEHIPIDFSLLELRLLLRASKAREQ